MHEDVLPHHVMAASSIVLLTANYAKAEKHRQKIQVSRAVNILSRPTTLNTETLFRDQSYFRGLRLAEHADLCREQGR